MKQTPRTPVLAHLYTQTTVSYSEAELRAIDADPTRPSDEAFKVAEEWMQEHVWNGFLTGRKRVDAMISLAKIIDEAKARL